MRGHEAKPRAIGEIVTIFQTILFMKKQLLFALLLLGTTQVFAQKNAFSVYYNQNMNVAISKIGAIGGRYAREVTPKLSIALGCDYEKTAPSSVGVSRLQIQNISTGAILFDKSVTTDHDININTYTIDVLACYNLLSNESRFNLSPFLGVSQRIFKYQHKPLIEVVNYEIVRQDKVEGTKYYTFPKAGVAFSYGLTKHLRIGTEFFYRTYLGSKSTELMTNASTAVSIEGAQIFDDEGRSAILTAGSGSSSSAYRYDEQAGISLALTYRF
jgi:hypothetical protein